MKTMRILFAFALCSILSLSAVSAFAGKKSDALSDLITKEVGYPEFARARQLNATVSVYIVQQEAGQISYQVRSSDKELARYVEGCMENLKECLARTMQTEKTAEVRFQFRFMR